MRISDWSSDVCSSDLVDSASGRLWYYQAGKQQGMMKVVVGTPETQTPMLAGTLHYAILNPYWNVPVSLAQKSIAKTVLSGRSLRSEEHTSELQSLMRISYAVLLLKKK